MFLPFNYRSGLLPWPLCRGPSEGEAHWQDWRAPPIRADQIRIEQPVLRCRIQFRTIRLD